MRRGALIMHQHQRLFWRGKPFGLERACIRGEAKNITSHLSEARALIVSPKQWRYKKIISPSRFHFFL
jgi:hypothetical protein